MPLSGPQWAAKFLPSSRIADLAEPFRTSVMRFIAALRAARAIVTVADTLRHPQRVYLMHHAFAIARLGMDPSYVPGFPGVDIQWIHRDADFRPDPAASRAAAENMVAAFGLAFPPVLHSLHLEGLAIDMSITWQDDLAIARADGALVTISTLPREGAHNTELHEVAAGYGVVKTAGDPPHWSVDGN